MVFAGPLHPDFNSSEPVAKRHSGSPSTYHSWNGESALESPTCRTGVSPAGTGASAYLFDCEADCYEEDDVEQDLYSTHKKFLVPDQNNQMLNRSIAAEDPNDYKLPPSEILEPEEPISNPNSPDLEERAQAFVLETKRIVIPGYPDAFNPSIIRWKGRLLMAFRTYHPKLRSTNEIAYVYLNEKFNPEGEPKFLKFRYPDPLCLNKRQDPRLLAADGKLYVIYNNAVKGEVRRMLVGVVETDGDDLIVNQVQCLFHFDAEREQRSEKNWVPFDYKGRVHLAYSLVPHRILSPLNGLNACETIASSLAAVKWNWGVLRGGTSALLEGGQYLAFFHSSKSMATQHSKGRSIPHYFMAAYTFSAEPPFHLTSMSPEPIVGKNFYKGPAYKTWKPLRVVFPGGYVADEKYIWVLYGRQDHEIWVAKMDKKGLLDSLIPVASP